MVCFQPFLLASIRRKIPAHTHIRGAHQQIMSHTHYFLNTRVPGTQNYQIRVWNTYLVQVQQWPNQSVVSFLARYTCDVYTCHFQRVPGIKSAQSGRMTDGILRHSVRIFGTTLNFAVVKNNSICKIKHFKKQPHYISFSKQSPYLPLT